MNIIEIILIGVSLAMDAFTVSVCKGLIDNNQKGFKIRKDEVILSLLAYNMIYYMESPKDLPKAKTKLQNYQNK